MNLQNNKLKNFTPLPNEIFSLHLSTGELATYAVLMRLEDPRTYECWPSYETIGKAIGKSKSSVKRYVAGLVEKGLITVEPTSVIMGNGLKKNGNLRYHIRPIREAVEWYTQQQLDLAEAAAERQWVQRKLSAQAAEAPCSSLRAAVWPCRPERALPDAGQRRRRSIAPSARWQVSRLWYGFRPLAETAPQTLHAG